MFKLKCFYIIILLIMFLTKETSHIKYLKIANIDDKNFDEFCDFLTTLYNNKEKFRIIFDLSNIEFKDFLYSKKLIDFMSTNRENTYKYIIKTAIIVPNKNTATFLNNFIFTFYEPQHPFTITYSLNDAKDFLE